MTLLDRLAGQNEVNLSQYPGRRALRDGDQRRDDCLNTGRRNNHWQRNFLPHNGRRCSRLSVAPMTCGANPSSLECRDIGDRDSPFHWPQSGTSKLISAALLRALLRDGYRFKPHASATATPDFHCTGAGWPHRQRQGHWSGWPTAEGRRGAGGARAPAPARYGLARIRDPARPAAGR